MQRYKKSAKSKTEQVKNLCHLRNLRDLSKINLRENKKASEIFLNLRLVIKEGGYLLSRIALQYHRRK